MKIGITAAFHPSVGGIETLARMLAEDFAAHGHEVTVITTVPADATADSALPYRVVRQPGLGALFRVMGGLDVVLQLGPMLRTGWAAFLHGVPVVISHQTWVDRRNGWLLPQGFVKKVYTLACLNIAASPALRSEPWGRTVLVPNCYDDAIFRTTPSESRNRELIFVGRLVPDKGADLLLQAAALLAKEGLSPTMTVVGDGPERKRLEQMVAELGLGGQVEFTGAQALRAVAALLNRHQILVVPSRWPEPFGIVALEGLACGCAVVVSDGGGLRDLAGSCGSVCPRNDVMGLAAALRHELRRQVWRPENDGMRTAQLEPYRPARMLARYLELLTGQTRQPAAHRAADPVSVKGRS